MPASDSRWFKYVSDEWRLASVCSSVFVGEILGGSFNDGESDRAHFERFIFRRIAWARGLGCKSFQKGEEFNCQRLIARSWAAFSR